MKLNFREGKPIVLDKRRVIWQDISNAEINRGYKPK